MIRVNLQPQVRAEVAEGFRLPPWVAILLGIIVFGAIGTTAYQITWNIAQANSTIKSLDNDLRDFQKIIKDYEDATDEKNYLTGKRDFVKSISENQKRWIQFFDELKRRIPRDVWLARMEVARNGAYTMEGGTFSYSAIGYFMLQMNSILAVQSVSLDSASSAGGATGQSKSGASIIQQLTKGFKISGEIAMDKVALVATPTQAMPAATGTKPVPSASLGSLAPVARK